MTTSTDWKAKAIAESKEAQQQQRITDAAFREREDRRYMARLKQILANLGLLEDPDASPVQITREDVDGEVMYVASLDGEELLLGRLSEPQLRRQCPDCQGYLYSYGISNRRDLGAALLGNYWQWHRCKVQDIPPVQAEDSGGEAEIKDWVKEAIDCYELVADGAETYDDAFRALIASAQAAALIAIAQELRDRR